VAKRSDVVSVVALAILALLAWIYLIDGAGMDDAMAMDAGRMAAATPGFALVGSMWAAMTIAMMAPSAAPTVLLYARTHRHAHGTQPPIAAFLAGYFACWLIVAVAAAALQLALERAALASPMTMALHGRTAGALVLIAVGFYQLSPFKQACLARCRSPAAFLAQHYRPGAAGALRLGLLHGAYCIGCCWLLMALLFVGGVMNLAWIAGITILVAAEKFLPAGAILARMAGIALIVWGGTRLLV
jgi:predicted metal-binding membrane protein